MTTDAAIQLVLDALFAWTKTAGPLLLAALVVGIAIGILQAATQINEASVTFLVKLVAMAATMVVIGAWSVQSLVDYTERTIGSIANVVR